jgi:hypothetical protein
MSIEQAVLLTRCIRAYESAAALGQTPVLIEVQTAALQQPDEDKGVQQSN